MLNLKNSLRDKIKLSQRLFFLEIFIDSDIMLDSKI